MKLKRLPEDFEVTELTDVVPAATGRFGLYRLTKRGLGTPEAVATVQRAWGLPRAALSYGGLKDRHALTRQHLTVEGGPPRDLEAGAVRLAHLGRCDAPFTPRQITGNRFRVVLRALGAAEEARALEALTAVGQDGLPNYFDDQRFGSVGPDGRFVARPWIEGDYEGALRLALAEPNPHDRPRDREGKRLLRERWGDWRGLSQDLPGGEARRVATWLAARPRDWAGALATVRPHLRSLWLAAFQSHLWNRLLAALLRQELPAADLVERAQRAGALVWWLRLAPPDRERLQALELPLPSARARLEPGPVQALVERVLAQDGLTLRALDVPGPRGSFFSKGSRAVLLRPRQLTSGQADDELYPGKRRLTLAFDLPRGAYATILVKRLTDVAQAADAPGALGGALGSDA